MIDVKVIKEVEDIDLPEYETSGSAGMDIRAYINTESLEKGKEATTLYPHTPTIISTGLKVAVPEGYEIQVRPRSGLAKRGIEVCNSPGTIDSDYIGTVGVILKNTTDSLFYVNNGDRVGQLVLAPIVQLQWKEVDTLEETDRGEGGFGSTGIS